MERAIPRALIRTGDDLRPEFLTRSSIASHSFEITKTGFFVKCIVNHSKAVFFSGMIQHRDTKDEGISYEDDYLGNALAVTITPGAIDIRFHKYYSDEAVETIFRNLLSLPQMEWAAGFEVAYQGRPLNVNPETG